MKLFLTILLLSFYIFKLTFGAGNVKFTLHKPHPLRKVARCYYEEYGHLSVGKTDPKDKCMSLKCHPDGSVTVFECGPRIFKGIRRCIKEKPLEPWKPWRECCPIHCPEMGNHYM